MEQNKHRRSVIHGAKQNSISSKTPTLFFQLMKRLECFFGQAAQTLFLPPLSWVQDISVLIFSGLLNCGTVWRWWSLRQGNRVCENDLCILVSPKSTRNLLLFWPQTIWSLNTKTGQKNALLFCGVFCEKAVLYLALLFLTLPSYFSWVCLKLWWDRCCGLRAWNSMHPQWVCCDYTFCL